MKNFGFRVLIITGAIVTAWVTAAVAKPITLELKILPKPVVVRPEMAALLTAGPLTLDVKDSRGADDPTVVGVLRAKGEDGYRWTTAQPVGPAVKELTTQVLNGWGVHVAPEAEFGLRLELTRFYVTERSDTFGSTYLGDVKFKVTFVDKSGGVLWTGEASGDSKRPGVDERASMCNEALSFALRRALAQALSSVKLETAAPAASAAPAAAGPIVIAPDALLADLTRLKDGGVADDVLVSYVEQRRLSHPLSVDEILAWKNAGIPDAAIKAATRP
jgi:hypothetical protein